MYNCLYKRRENEGGMKGKRTREGGREGGREGQRRSILTLMILAMFTGRSCPVSHPGSNW